MYRSNHGHEALIYFGNNYFSWHCHRFILQFSCEYYFNEFAKRSAESHDVGKVYCLEEYALFPETNFSSSCIQMQYNDVIISNGASYVDEMSHF